MQFGGASVPELSAEGIRTYEVKRTVASTEQKRCEGQ